MTKRQHPLPEMMPCKYCGTPVKPLTNRHKYCSELCKARWSREFGTRKHMQDEYDRRKREKYAADGEYRARIVLHARSYVADNRDKKRVADAKYRDNPERRERAADRSRAWHENNKDRANTRRIVRKQVQRSDRPWNIMVSGARKRAKDAGIPFDLTDEWGAARWTGKCELTGIPFRIVRGMGTKIFAPSLDRIVPSLGYVQGNCRFILFCVNAFKHNGTDNEMFMVADALMKTRSQRFDGTNEAQLLAAE